MSQSVRVDLIEQGDGENEPIEAFALLGDGQVWLGAEGYEDFHGAAQLVLLEQYEGKLLLTIWADKSSEEPTHVIDLERARA